MTRMVRNPHTGNLVPEHEVTTAPINPGRSPLGAACVHLGLARSLGWDEGFMLHDIIRLARMGQEDVEVALRAIASQPQFRDRLAASGANGLQLHAIVAGLVLGVHLISEGK